MNRYVKKPIAIEAVKWQGFNNDEIKDFAGDWDGHTPNEAADRIESYLKSN